MSALPDFSSHGYQVVRQLGYNRTGGRVTYLATSTSSNSSNNTGELAVIKQFQFAQTGANWSDYETCDREIHLLQHLNHPNIPRYLGCFQTETGFCIVQEYKQAPSLASVQQWTLDEIQLVAAAVLEVLVYLQQELPPVIHRDIKPENILVDRQETIKVYLVDFGFASLGGGEVAISSAVKGTLGFMPPEQLFNRELTEASDLYSLGATLICLLTKTKSSAIGTLIDDTYHFKLKKLLPNLERRFAYWLEKMVSPNPKERFQNAAAALEALKSLKIIDVKRLSPEKYEREKKRQKRRVLMGVTALGITTAISTIWAFLGSLENAQLTDTLYSVHYKLYETERSLGRALSGTHQCLGCNLRGANLKGANLSHSNYRGANLERADLRGAYLLQTVLTNANLKGANLGYADLKGSYFGMANLENANFWKAKLGNAYLVKANLKRADLRGGNLNNANFSFAKLEEANLGYASLRYANLASANLKNTNLFSADLFGANLAAANLEIADLRSAKLQDANLQNVKLNRAKLTDAVLIYANLETAELAGAELAGAHLGGAKLLTAYLEKADLTEANLENSDLRGANLRGASLKRVNLRGANLQGANLQGADIEGANLRNANLKGAIMPNGKTHP